jgi:hypothetical protein
MRKTPEQRFWRYVDKNGPVWNGSHCWIWTRGKFTNGYGAFTLKDHMVGAHKYSYELLNGKIPDNLEPDHLCRNKSCVNPSHIEVVTHRENVKRGILPEINKLRARAITHCNHGHPFDTANTHISVDGWRVCRICQRLKTVRYRAKIQKEVSSIKEKVSNH